MRLTLIAIVLLSFIQAAIPQTVDESYMWGYAYYQQGKMDAALSSFTSYLERHPDDLEVRLIRGRLYFEKMQYEMAKTDFQVVEKKRSGMAGFWLAKTEVRLNHKLQAVKYLRENLSSRYRELEKTILLDEDLSKLESLPEWKELWNEKEWYSTIDRDFQDLEILLAKDAYPDALNLLRTLEKKGVRKSEVLLKEAKIYYLSGNLKAAVESAESAVKSDVRNHDALLMRAELYTLNEKYDKALEDCNKLLYQQPETFSAYLLRARILIAGDRRDEANTDYELYLNYFPESDSVLDLKGQNLYQQKKYISALQSFNQALKLNKGEAGYYYDRGLVYAATGSLQFASRDFSMALDLDPLNGETWLEKGRVEVRLGKKDIACHDFEKAYQLGSYEAREWLESNCLQNK